MRLTEVALVALVTKCRFVEMAGRPYSGQLSEAIRRARAFVLILSRKSDQSGQVLREVERAANSRLHLAAFRIEDFEASDDLGYFLSVEHGVKRGWQSTVA